MSINTQSLRKVNFLAFSAVILFVTALLTSVDVRAGDDIDIDRASWSSDRDRLTVRGDNAPDDGIVTIRYGEKEDNGAVIGTTQADDDGEWEFRISGIDPVPCDVTAIAGGDDDDKEVRNAPSDCSNDGGVQPPPVNNAPVLTPIGDKSVTDGSNLIFTVTASDDGQPNDTLAISANNLPAGATFTDNGNGSGSFNWLNVSPVGSTDTTFTVSDGDLNDSETITITVTDVAPPGNNAPVCTIDTPAGNVTINVGESVNYAATVTDADNDPLTISWSFNGGSPAGSNAEDPGAVTYNAAGSFNTTLTASDGQASCATQTRTIIVQDNNVPPAPNVSINSTSQNTTDVGVAPNGAPVAEQPFVGNNSHRVMAINDLGMHCGDFDTRIASILPPFQVLLAQVVEIGATPRLLNNVDAEVVYSAVSNPNDPILSNPNFAGVSPDGSVFKTNFWDIATQAYDPFYPQGILGPVNADTGLPVPNVEDLFIGPDGIVNSGDEHLTAVTHAMPGIAGPYVNNDPLVAHEFYVDKPFFVNFPFGYVANDLSWFEGAGIPFAAYDDYGREAPYPLVRVQANVAGNTVATTDTVLPISGEASCKNCHSPDVTSGDHPGAALVNMTDVASELDDPAMGTVPVNVSVEYATDLNVLKLHDQKHGTMLVTGTTNDFPVAGTAPFEPVVCQVCHYTPALDLAQLGPLGPGNDGPLVLGGVEISPSLANGRTQLTQSTMSNVMHSHHGSTGLFPDIPAPVQNATGTVTNQTERVAAMEASCYQCHPGTDTQCLRGAMFNGDMLCSDCHGSMQQVGNDFSAGVSPATPGAFDLSGNFYDPNDPQPRVPWANEPGCGSCHTGDVSSNEAGTAGTIVNTRDMDGNVDGIRLRQAFRSDDAKATPIVPVNNRFAENIVPADFNGVPNPGAGNPQLYRVSTGHGGVMCEGCHGATHAEWPNANPMSNDNITANQLQGHTGTITECSSCHTNVDNLSTDGSLNSLQGPHGMHTVGITSFADADHKRNLDKDACRECHGQNGEGSVLSRTAADRDFSGIKDGGFVPKGTPVTCDMCHSNKL